MSDRIPTDFALLVEMGMSDPEIADRVGVSSRTVLRWRGKLSLASRWMPPAPEHGRPGRYSRGCRCAECRAAHAAYQRTYYHRRQQEARTA